jgi:hypothetical protein
LNNLKDRYKLFAKSSMREVLMSEIKSNVVW